jgi:hypothetical protein
LILGGVKIPVLIADNDREFADVLVFENDLSGEEETHPSSSLCISIA